MPKIKATLLGLAGMCLVGCANHMPLPQTSNKTAHRIHAALPRYQALADNPWLPIQTTGTLKPHTQDQAVPLIRQRLALLGDLPNTSRANMHSEFFDSQLEAAVKLFQWRHGIKQTGTIDKKTLAALNITPAEKLRRLSINMGRWAKFPEHEGSHYIRVNVASFDLDVVRDGSKVLNMKVIAGKPTRQTPTLYSKLKTLVFNPSWNVPRTIARKDIIPKIRENPNYLAENNIQIFKSWQKNAIPIDPTTIDWHAINPESFRYRFRQQSGQKNALGRVKFVFSNKHDVYLHDTPEKGLFNTLRRAYSSGCIRLHQPMRLVEYFIENNPRLKPEKIQQYLVAGKTQYVRIDNPLPIYIAYITAWVDAQGRAHFREDIYQKDVSPKLI